MSEISTLHSFPDIQSSQAQNHVTDTKTVRLLNMVIQIRVLSDLIAGPPSDADEAECKIIPQNAKSAESGRALQIADLKTGLTLFHSTKKMALLFDYKRKSAEL